MVPFEKYETVSFASSIMKNIVEFSCSRFAVNVICLIAPGSASCSCFLFKSIANNLKYFFEYVFKLTVLLKPFSNCSNTFAVDKVTNGT